jgi:SAM-dependent methyltransferase
MSALTSYAEWTDNRVMAILKHYEDEFFYGMHILELGCATGDLGKRFEEYGAVMTYTDARRDKVRYLGAHRKWYVQDLNKGLGTDEYFDVILHLGVLYHLENVEQSIMDACRHCDHLVLETEVVDYEEPLLLRIAENPAYLGASITGVGYRPSPALVEAVLDKAGFEHTRIREGLSCGGNNYDWEAKGEGYYVQGQRAFWICRRKE